MGRKKKLTPEITSQICDLIEKGLPYNLLCGAVGINYSTFADWITKGEAGKNGYTEFSEAVNKSKATYALKCLKRVDDYADNGSIFCATWLLEKRFPKEFGKRENLDIKSQNENLNVNADLKPKNPEAIEQAIIAKLTRIRERSNCSGTLEEPNN